MTAIRATWHHSRDTVRSSLVRNGAFLMGTTVVTSLVGYLYWVVAARGYASSAVGLATALISLFSLVSYATCFGITPVLIQVLPKAADAEAWETLFTVSTGITSGLGGAACAIVGVILPFESRRFEVLHTPLGLGLFTAGGLLSTAALAVDGAFIASRRSGLQLTRSAVFSVAKIPVMLLPLALVPHAGALAITGSWAAGLTISIAVGLACVRMMRSGFRFRTRGGLRAVTSRWRLMIGHHLAGLGGQLPNFLFGPLVVVMLSAADNAYFYLTWSVGAAFLMVSTSISQALFAEGSNAEDLHRTVRRAVAYITVLLAPIMLICFVFAHRILMLFGPEYASHGTMLFRIQVVCAVPDAITNVFVAVAYVRRRLAPAVALNLWMSAVAIGLAVAFLRPFGINGVGWAWLAAQSSGSVAVAAMWLWPRRARLWVRGYAPQGPNHIPPDLQEVTPCAPL